MVYKACKTFSGLLQQMMTFVINNNINSIC